MKKIRLKRKIRIKKRSIIAFLIILMMFLINIFLSFINDKITPVLIGFAEPEINKLSTIVVNNAISRVLENNFNEQEIFNTVMSSDGKIQTIDFNPIIVNKILSIATTAVQNDLRFLEDGELEKIGIENIKISQTKIEKLRKGIILEIPIGVVFQKSLLSNIGPKIPIRLHYVGNVNSNIVTKLNSYGINNALVEIGIKMNMSAQVVLPLSTKQINIDSYIPIAIKVIQGTVPNYYSSGLENQSQIYSLPF